MKKTLAIISAAIMLLCGILTITGCNIKDNSNNNNSKAEVVLDKVSAAAYIEKSIQPQAISIFNLSENSADSSNSESKEDTPDISVDIPTDYTFIFKSQLEINFDIKLNNPKNYYIMDFKLTCDEEQIEYYDKEMEKWTPINDIWIRWSGSNNQESRYRLRLPNPEISPDKIKISEMYYSDRTDGTNKTAVNMNNKETYTVYKVEDDLVVTETVSNRREKYVFKMAKKEGVEIKSFTVAGVDYMDRINAEGLYEMTSNGKIVVKYERKNGNVTYKGKVEKDVELIEFHETPHELRFKWFGRQFYIYYKITGTGFDISKISIDGIDCEIEESYKDVEKTVLLGYGFYGIDGLSDDWFKEHTITICGVKYNIWDTFVNTTKE